jgi:hypothetical protein
MEGMSRELFSAIGEQAVNAAGPHAPKITEFDPRKHRIVVMPDGTSEAIAADPAPRKHAANDLGSLKTIAEAAAQAGHKVVCWATRRGVMLVLNDDGYRDSTVTLGLELSPQLALLMSIEKSSPAMSQRELISTLRIKFRECGLPDGLVDMLRKVAFKISDEGASELQRTKTSVGRSQMAAMHGLDALPEWLSFQVPVFAGCVFATIATIPVALDPDPETQTFKLIPQLGVIEKKIQLAETELVGALASMMPESVPVYFGTP